MPTLIDDSLKAKNYLINSNFDFWQRGTSFSTFGGGTYLADRWRMSGGSNGTYTVSRQAFTIGQSQVPNSPGYYLKWAQTGAATSSNMNLNQIVEGVKTLAGSSCTFSIWMRCNSGLNSVSLQIQQYFGSGGSPSATTTVATQGLTLTSSWQKYTISASIPSISGKTLGTDGKDGLTFQIILPASGTWDIDIAQAQVNEGFISAQYQMAGQTLQQELAICQRYYEKSYDIDTTPATATQVGMISIYHPTSTNVRTKHMLRVPKRTASATVNIYPTNGSIVANQVSHDVTANQGIANNFSDGLSVGWEMVNNSSDTRSYFHFTCDAEL